MRLFAAIDPPAAAVDDLGRRIAGLRNGWPALRWGDAARWHLTLAFYGEVDDRRVGELARRLVRAANRAAPLPLQLAGAGGFPSARRAQVAWVGLSGELAGLSRLADACAAAGRRCGLGVDDRGYRPHLTLARARHPPQDLTELVAQLSPYAGPPWVAGQLRLVASTLGPQPRHDTVAGWPLRSGAPADHPVDYQA